MPNKNKQKSSIENDSQNPGFKGKPTEWQQIQLHNLKPQKTLQIIQH